MPLAVVVAVGAGIASNAVARVPGKAILALGLLLVTGGLIMLARTPADASYPARILPVLVAIGLGITTTGGWPPGAARASASSSG